MLESGKVTFRELVMRLMPFVLLLFTSIAVGNNFSDLVGPVGVQPVKDSPQVLVHTITWGGDVPFYVANGNSVTTAKNSTYDALGLNIKFENQDDFVQQCRDYLTGKTPFIRGTFDMLGIASEVLGSDPKTKPQVFLQLSYSQGDHVVGRISNPSTAIRNLNDLKHFAEKANRKPRGVIQQGGPHVGFINDVLKAAQMTWDDIEVVWATDLSGPNGPAEHFRKDINIDFCTVITPDMLGLTGGLEATGTGAEGTVTGARVFVSTAQMSRSIADVLAVRKDWYDSHKDWVEKFAAGYFFGCEKVVALRKQFDETSKMSNEYKNVLTTAQNVFGKTVIPTLEVDGHGLLLDCTFVGLAGNMSFFTDKGNLNGFDKKQASALDLATSRKYAGARMGFDPVVFNYKHVAQLVSIKYEPLQGSKERIVAEATEINPEDNLDDRTIVSFTINFEPNQEEFSVDQYGAEFNRVIENAASFGNAVVAIRGHSDPTKTIVDFLKVGIKKGLITRSGKPGAWEYFINDNGQSKALNVSNIKTITDYIKRGVFQADLGDENPTDTMQAALTLSYKRAASVKEAVAKFAKQQNVNLDLSQIQPVGAGIVEPVISKPKNSDEARKNMRVEFRVLRVPAEAIKSSDFDY